MKNIFCLLFCFLVCGTLFAQDQDDQSEKAEREQILKEAEVDRLQKDDSKTLFKQMESRDRLIFEVMHDNWLNKPDSLKVKWWNRGFNSYIMYDVGLFNSKNVSVAPGIGISTSNVYHKSTLRTNDTISYFSPINDTLSWRKNKLSTTFVEVPLELRFRTNPDKFNKSFKLSLGVRFGYMLSSKTKYKGDQHGLSEEVFFKNKRLPNINKFRYGTSIRLGYGNFNIVAYYALSTLFEANKGPGIHPLSIGISFNSF